MNRKFINFYIGGGANKKIVYIRLLVDGKEVARTAGKDNEALSPGTWDVSDYQDKMGQIEIVDNATGGWGHINVDHFVFSNSAGSTPAADTGGFVISQEVLNHVAKMHSVSSNNLERWIQLLTSNDVKDLDHPFYTWFTTVIDPILKSETANLM